MKILIDTYNTAYQAEFGGINLKVTKLYESLRAEGINIDYFDKKNTRIEEYDILHIIRPTYEHYPLILYAKGAGVKIVISSVTQRTLKSYRKLMVALSRIHITTVHSLQKDIFNIADWIITESEEEIKFIRDCYSVKVDKFSVLPVGVDELKAKKKSNLVYNYVEPGKPYVLCTGRFDENKNQLRLIQALNGTDIPLILIGGPIPESKGYFEKCKKVARENIYFLGWVEHESELFTSAYQNASLVVMPSIVETFGIALFEGIAAGTNVLASNTIRLEEWGIASDSYFTNIYDVDSIYKDIARKILAPVNQSTYENVMKKLSWKTVARKHIDIYNSIINNK